MRKSKQRFWLEVLIGPALFSGVLSLLVVFGGFTWVTVQEMCVVWFPFIFALCFGLVYQSKFT